MASRSPEVAPMPVEIENNRRLARGGRERLSMLDRMKRKFRELLAIPAAAGDPGLTGQITAIDASLDGATAGSEAARLKTLTEAYRRDPTSTTLRTNLNNLNAGLDARFDPAAAGSAASELRTQSGELLELYDSQDSDYIYHGSLERAADSAYTPGATPRAKGPDSRVLAGRVRCHDMRTGGVIEELPPAAAGAPAPPTADAQLTAIEAYLAAQQNAADDSMTALGHFQILMRTGGVLETSAVGKKGAELGVTLSRIIEGEKKLIAAQGGEAKGKLYIFDIAGGRLVDVFAGATVADGFKTATVDLPEQYFLLNLSENAASVPDLGDKIAAWVNEGKDVVEISAAISALVKAADPTHKDIAIAISQNGQPEEKVEDVQLPSWVDKAELEDLTEAFAGRAKTLAEQEERDRIYTQRLDKMGFLGALFRSRAERREANKFSIAEDSPEMRHIRSYAYEQALRQILERRWTDQARINRLIGQLIPESQRQANRLMEQTTFGSDARGFSREMWARDRTGALVPTGERDIPFGEGTWWGRLFEPRRVRPTGGIFLGGAGLGFLARQGISRVIGLIGTGLGWSMVGGGIAGGVMGFLKGRRQATEALYSGEAWSRELDTALASGNEDEIRRACFKVENLLGARQNEIFRDRSRVEALGVISRYQEGLRRLALGRISRETAEAAPGLGEDEKRTLAADKYAELCRAVAADERKLMESPAFYSVYKNAILDELRVIGPEEVSAPGGPSYPIASREISGRALTAAEQAKKDALRGDLESQIKEKKGRWWRIAGTAALKGALLGAVAGGVGWWVGHWISGMLSGHGQDAATAAGGAHHGAVPGPGAPGPEGAVPAPGGVVPGPGGLVPHGTEVAPAGGQHWIQLTNRFTIPQQEFTEAHARAIGFGDVLDKYQYAIDTYADPATGIHYAQYDIGGYIREAARIGGHVGEGYGNPAESLINWQGANESTVHHFVNALNLLGRHHLEVPIGAEYPAVSTEQLQALYDAWRTGGDDIMVNGAGWQIINDHGFMAVGNAIHEAAGAAGAVGSEAAGTAGAAGVAEAAAKGGLRSVSERLPGWLLLAGAGVGLAGGMAIGAAADKGVNRMTGEPAEAPAPGARPGRLGAVEASGAAYEDVERRRRDERLARSEQESTDAIAALETERENKKKDLEIKDKLDGKDGEVFLTSDEAERRLAALPEPMTEDDVKTKAVNDRRVNFKGAGSGCAVRDFDGITPPAAKDAAYDSWDLEIARKLLPAWREVKRVDQLLTRERANLARIQSERSALRPAPASP